MAREEAAALHLIAPGFQRVRFIDSGRQIGLVVFFRNFDGYVYAVVFNDGKDKGLSVDCWLINPSCARTG